MEELKKVVGEEKKIVEKEEEKKEETVTIVKALGRAASSATALENGTRVLSDVIWQVDQPLYAASVLKFREDEKIDHCKLDLSSLVWKLQEKQFITIQVPVCPHEHVSFGKKRKSIAKQFKIFSDADISDETHGVTVSNLLTELFLFYSSVVTPEDEVEIATMDDQCCCRKYFQELSVKSLGCVTYGALLDAWTYFAELSRQPSSDTWFVCLTPIPLKRTLQDPKSKQRFLINYPSH